MKDGNGWFYLLRKPNKKNTHWIYRFGQSEQTRVSSRLSAHRNTGFEFTDYVVMKTEKGKSKDIEDNFKFYIEGLAGDTTENSKWHDYPNCTIDWWTCIPETIKIKWKKTNKNFSYFTTPIDIDFIADVDSHENTLTHCFAYFHKKDGTKLVEWESYKKRNKYKVHEWSI